MTLRPSQVRAAAADTAMMVPAAVGLRRRYDELRMPSIALASEGDLIVHVGEHAQRLADEISSVELRIIPGQGHLLHYAVPEHVVADCQRTPLDTRTTLTFEINRHGKEVLSSTVVSRRQTEPDRILRRGADATL